MDLKTINFKIENEIAFIKLNRPKQYNSLNQAMAEDLFQVSLECDDNPNIRSVLMSGVGDDAFCAGGDVNSFHKYVDDSHYMCCTDFTNEYPDYIYKFCIMILEMLKDNDASTYGFILYKSLAVGSS